MQYCVTPEQRSRLADARDGWPDRLTKLRYFRGTDGSVMTCAVGYLASRIGFRRNEQAGDLVLEVSRYYGIPTDVLCSLTFENDVRHFLCSPERRAMEMKRAFERFISRTSVIGRSLHAAETI